MMKHFNLFGLLLLTLALGSTGCSKTGPAGPQGVQGTKGEQGPAGPQGIAGADGSTIYNGSNTPDAQTGKTGDYYLDKSNGSLYGPKTDKGWGTPISLKGPQGDQGMKGNQGAKGDQGDSGPQGPAGESGKDGSQILSGDSIPTSSMGKAGDYYWNTTSFTLYGPKTASGWGSGIGLRGPQGPKGDKGDPGDPGNANVVSSGWISTWQIWTSMTQKDGITFSEPGDLDVAVYHGAPYKINSDDANGAVLAYVDDGQGIKPVRFQAHIDYHSDYLGACSDDLEFRFVIAKPQSAADESYDVFPVVALKNGAWDLLTPFSIQSYMQAHYLNKLKWKFIIIPANIVARQASHPPDPKDYKATCTYYGIPQ